MPATMTETDDDLIDATNHEVPIISLPDGTHTTVELYPTVGESEHGTMKREWGASQTEGIKLADVIDFEITDFESDDADSMDEFEAEYREWVEATLFSEGKPNPIQDVDVRYLGDGIFELENQWEPETLTVELVTENERRV